MDLELKSKERQLNAIQNLKLVSYNIQWATCLDKMFNLYKEVMLLIARRKILRMVQPYIIEASQ